MRRLVARAPAALPGGGPLRPRLFAAAAGPGGAGKSPPPPPPPSPPPPPAEGDVAAGGGRNLPSAAEGRRGTGAGPQAGGGASAAPPLEQPSFAELIRHHDRVAGKMAQPPPHALYATENVERLERWQAESEREYRRRSGRATWRAAGMMVLFSSTMSLGAFAWICYNQRPYQARVGEEAAAGKPDVGGSFTLVDHDGRFRSSEEFRGKYTLIYFGFTFCPDVCPQEMEKQERVADLVAKHYRKEDLLVPIFITVDPVRDTVAQVRRFCKEFGPRMLGFTGTPEMIRDVTRKFRVYYNPGLRTDEEDYLVDHSIILYLMDRRGKFLDFFGKNMTDLEVFSKIKRHIDADIDTDNSKTRKAEGRWFKDIRRHTGRTWSATLLDLEEGPRMWVRMKRGLRGLLGPKTAPE